MTYAGIEKEVIMLAARKARIALVNEDDAGKLGKILAKRNVRSKEDLQRYDVTKLYHAYRYAKKNSDETSVKDEQVADQYDAKSYVSFVLAMLLAAIFVVFLISESAPFYDEYISSTLLNINGIIIASSLEGAILFFVLTKTREKIINTIMIIFLLLFSSFSFSTKVLVDGGIDISKADSNIEIRQQIKEQIKANEKKIEYYQGIKWPGNVTRLDVENQKLREKLRKTEADVAGNKSSQGLTITIVGQVVLRILLQILSILMMAHVRENLNLLLRTRGKDAHDFTCTEIIEGGKYDC